MSAVFGMMKYLGDLQGLKDLYNTHFSYGLLDDDHWGDFLDSPIFPIQEEPESDNFYILYNYSESHQPEKWWYVDATVSVYISSNNIKLIDDVTRVIRREVGDYESAVKRISDWASDNSIDMPPVNWIRYVGANSIQPQEQENGVYGRILTFSMNYVDC